MSVDLSYETDKDHVIRTLKQTLRKNKVDWPCVMDPKGWLSVAYRFNLDGYSLTLVGPDGIVRGVNLQVEDVKRLLPTVVSRSK